MNVEGKAALITGGGTGVGRATALALAERGCAVAVNYSRSKDEAEQTAAEIEKRGVRGVAIQADVARDADCRRLVETAVGELGRLDVLVQSAGVTSFIPHPNLDDVKDEDWEKIFAVNVRGKFQCARAAKAPMASRPTPARSSVSSPASSDESKSPSAWAVCRPYPRNPQGIGVGRQLIPPPTARPI